MLSLAVGAIGIFQPWTLYLTIPFFELPLLLALEISISNANTPEKFTNKGFWTYFGLYYNPQYFGVFRVIVNYLFSLLTSLVVTLLFVLAYYYIGIAVDSVFASGVNEMLKALENGGTDTVNAIASSNASIYRCLVITSLVESGVLYLTFTYRIAIWTLNPYIRLDLKSADAAPRMANSLFIGGYRKIRGELLKELWKANWLGFFLLAAGFVGGLFLPYLWAEAPDPAVMAASGIAVSWVCLFFYLPYFFITIAYLAERFMPAFAQYSLEFAEQTLKQLKHNQQIDEEEAAEVERMITEAKEKAKEEEDEEKGNPTPKDDSKDGDSGPDDKTPPEA